MGSGDFPVCRPLQQETVAEGDTAAVWLTLEVQQLRCDREVHSSVLFAALADLALGERESARVVLEREVIRHEARVLLNEQSQFVYIGRKRKSHK